MPVKTVLKTLSLAAALAIASPAVNAAPESAATCVACHGERGAAPILPIYPVLAGQYADYLEHTLKAYKEGTRRNAIMVGIAANLSDREIRELARYFAAQQGPLYTPSIGR